MLADGELWDQIHALPHTLILMTNHRVVHFDGVSQTVPVVRVPVHGFLDGVLVIPAHYLSFLQKGRSESRALVRLVSQRTCEIFRYKRHLPRWLVIKCTYLPEAHESLDVTEVLSEFLVNAIAQQFARIELVRAELVSPLLRLHQLLVTFAHGGALAATRPR